MDLSVVIPVYNEQDSIKLLVKQLIDLQEQLPEKIMQIIFVDDGYISSESHNSLNNIYLNLYLDYRYIYRSREINLIDSIIKFDNAYS
jgi:hypothetical protein